MEHTEERFLIHLSLIAAAVMFIIIGMSVIGSSSADDLQPGETFVSETEEHVMITYYVYNDSYVFVGDGESIDIGEATKVTIPETVTHEPSSKEYIVSAINHKAFYCDSSLTEVIIPSSVSWIGTSAFDGTSLSSLDLNKVNKIYQYAFAGISITELTISDSVIDIGTEAFAYCNELETVHFGKNISSLGTGVFLKSPVKTMDVSDGNTKYTTVDNVLLDKETQRILYLFPTGRTGEYEVPAGVTTIDNYSFYGCSLESIKFAKSVATIGDYAFFECEGLKSYNDSKCTSLAIGNYAFSETGLESVDISSNVMSVGNYAFSSCYDLKDAEIDTSGTLGYYLFYECTGLEHVEVGQYTVLTESSGLYGYTFYGCTSLTTIEMSPEAKSSSIYSVENGVLYGRLITATINQRVLLCYPAGMSGSEFKVQDAPLLGPYAFALSNIETVVIESANTVYDYAFYGCSNLRAVTFGDKVVTICSHAFDGCTKLDIVTIPISVVTIDDYAFSNCSSMKSVYGCTNVISLGCGVFFSCFSLQEISISNSKLEISSSAEEKGLFEMCTSLYKVTLPSSPEILTEIGYNMFYGCESLKELDIPSKVNVIKEGAFEESGIETIKLPNAITEIEKYAFYGCRSLTSVTITEDKSKLTTIGDYAFYGCSALTSIKISASATTIGDYAFCHSGLVTFSAPNKVSTVGEGAFKYCTSLTSASLPGLTEIADELMYGCRSLESFDIGQNVTSIGDHAFYGCTSLSSVKFNAKECAALGEDALAFGRTGEFTITFSDNVQEIPDYLFYSADQTENTKVTSISVGSSVSSIGAHSFAMCTFLESFTFNSVVYSSEISIVDCLQCAGTDVPSGLTVVIGSGITVIADDMFRFTLAGEYAPKITVLEIGENVSSIGTYAFADNIYVTEIRYNAKTCGDLSVSSQAFMNCGSSSSEGICVTIGKKVTVLPAYIFYTADPADSPRIASIITSGLPNITFNESIFNGSPYLKEIDVTDSTSVTFSEDSFSGSTALERLSVGDGKASFADSSFSGCTAMTYFSINASECTVTGINVFENAGKAGAGIEVIFGNKIKAVPANMFYSYDGSEEDTAPNIASITIGTSIKSIGNYAFYRCSPDAIIIPDNVSVIGDYSFSGSGAQSLTIGKGVTSIGSNAFGSMLCLTDISFNAVSCSDLSSDGSVFYKAGGSSSGVSVVFGSEAARVPGFMFYAGGVEEADAPNLSSIDLANVSTIGQYAFSNCSTLTSVTVPDTVQSIGTHAFENCSNIADINFNAVECGSLQNIVPFYKVGSPSGLTVKFGDGVSNVPDYMFYGSRITSPVELILNNVTTIGSYAFSGLNIISLKIPDISTVIGVGSFFSCVSLTSVTIGKKVSSIGRFAFSGCTSLSKIDFNAENCSDLIEGSDVFSGCTHNISVTYGNTVKRVPAYLFSTSSSSNDPRVTSVVISEGVSEIASEAFASCRYMTDLTIGQDVTVIGTMKGLVSLTSLKFNATGCSDLGHSSNTFSDAGTSGAGFSVNFGNTVERIPANLFYVDYIGVTPKLTSISYSGSSVTEIGEYAFAGLQTSNIPVPEGVRTIGSYALYGALKTNMPTTVMDIGDHAYSGSGLVTAIIPKGVTVISSGVFSDCASLSAVSIPSTVTSIGSDSFRHCTSLGSVDVDSDNAAYTSIDGVLFSKDMTTLILYPSQKLGTSYYVPDGVTTLSQESFYRCLKLNKLVISSKVRTTSGGAVKECTNLTYITIPSSIISLTTDDFTGLVFYDSDEITVLDINQTIGYTFKGMKLIKNITISFDSNGGSDVEPIIEKVDTPISAPDSPVKEGYSFTKWQYNGEDYTFTVMPAENITLTAVWVAKKYTVILDCNGGKSDVDIQAEYDSKLPSFKAVTKVGYTLKGYFRTAESDEMIIDSSGILLPSITGISDGSGKWKCDSDMTFYARWSVNTYVVTFESNGGGTPSMESKEVAYDCEYGELATVNRVGYTFSGWFTARIGGSLVVETSICEIPYDHKLYACWTQNIYTVTFDPNGGEEPSMVSKEVAYDGEYGALATVSRTGYTFIGWYTNGSGGVQILKDTICTVPSDHTIYAHWTPNSYTVSFDPNGGGTPSMTSKKVTYDSQYGPLPSVRRSGYTFTGWYTYGSEGAQILKDTVCTVPSDHMIYAHWTPNSYTVSFDPNGGGTPSMASKNVTYDSPYGTLATVERAGYMFIGWFTTSSEGTEVTSDTICRTSTVHSLYAHWECLSHVAYFINEGTTFSEFSGEEGDVIIPPQDTPTKAPSTDKVYVFDHWDGYTSGMEMPNHDIRFYAVYTSVPREYKATFMNEKSVHEVFSIEYGKAIPSPSTDPAKPEDNDFSYEFKGWNGYYKGIIMTGDITFDAVYLSVVKNIEVSEGKAVTPVTSDNTVRIDSNDLSSVKSKVGSGEVSSMEIRLSEGSITLDGNSIMSLPSASTNASIIQINDHSVLPSAIIPKVDGRTVYSINLGDTHEFGGTLTITVKYTLKDGEDPNDLRISYLSSDGSVTEYQCTYHDGKVTFTTDHLSYYAVTLDEKTVNAGPPLWVVIIIAAGAIIAMATIIVALKKKGMFD